MQQNSNGRAIWITAAASIAIALAGCGGGSSGSPPALGSTAFTTNENVKLAGQLTASDPQGQSVTFTQTSSPTNGMLVSLAASGAFVYQPKVNFTGADSFGVKVTDSGGNAGTGTVSITVHVNQPPTASNAAVRADGAALNSINVLSSAKDPDGDPLTVTIQQQPLVGTAAVNAAGAVSITGLPSGFKGLIQFQYRVTDPSAAYAVGTMAVFVGADPFRAAFAGDPSANGSPEVYVTDFADTPTAVTQATQGNMRLQGFAASASGATLVYRRADITALTTTDLWFVQATSPGHALQIMLPSGATVVEDSNGRDQYQVSPDAQWIAVVAASGGAYTLYVLNVTNPTQLSVASPKGTLYVDLPRFSVDSKNLYFLATPAANRANRSLYTVALSAPTVNAQVSAVNATPTDDVLDYFVAPDQSRIVLQANRASTEGFYFIDPKSLRVEVQLNQTLGLGETILGDATTEPPGLIASPLGDQIAYTTQPIGSTTAYIAQVSATPTRQSVGQPGSHAIRFRPDEAALLYETLLAGPLMYETGTPDQLLGPGFDAWYDSTGNIVLLKQVESTGSTYYLALASTVRGAFGKTQPVSTPGDAVLYFTASGFDRAVVILAQGSPSASVSSAQLQLVDAMAPGAALPLADFQTPLHLTSDLAQVITY